VLSCVVVVVVFVVVGNGGVVVGVVVVVVVVVEMYIPMTIYNMPSSRCSCSFAAFAMRANAAMPLSRTSPTGRPPV
jgi:hypothetical protein